MFDGKEAHKCNIQEHNVIFTNWSGDHIPSPDAIEKLYVRKGSPIPEWTPLDKIYFY